MEWVKVYTTASSYEAELVKGMLENHGIRCVIINKQDSAYVSIGENELYVPREEVLKASHLIRKKDEDSESDTAG